MEDGIKDILATSNAKYLSQEGEIWTVSKDGLEMVIDFEQKIYLIDEIWWKYTDNPVWGNIELHLLARRMIFNRENTGWVAPSKTFADRFDEWFNSLFL
jgi:hypothetical protein